MVTKHSIENISIMEEVTTLQQQLLSNVADKKSRDAKLAKLCNVSETEDARLKKSFGSWTWV